MLYTEGRYREVIVECDGAGGTERTPWFDRSTGGGQEGAPAPDVTIQPIVVSHEDVQHLIVEPGGLIVQPDRSWVLINTETVVMTDAAEHILRTRVLEVDVDVRVTPVLYTWDFGDGSAPLTGTDPGAPWPNHTVAHVYDAPGTVVISLRTEWDAAFRVAGTSTWLPVAGRAVTTQSTEPIEVLTATPRLTTG
ncbi:PKD domain-containing protein [Georgenia wutianyii]|nr:PKD domain-containing protein [Georgenia wutianyii]